MTLEGYRMSGKIVKMKSDTICEGVEISMLSDTDDATTTVAYAVIVNDPERRWIAYARDLNYTDAHRFYDLMMAFYGGDKDNG